MDVQIAGVDIWGDARDATTVDAPPVSPARTRDTWERFRRQGRAAGMSRKESVAYATREVEKLHPPPPDLPPLPPPPVVQDQPKPQPDQPQSQPAAADQAPAAGPTTPPPSAGGVQGLGDLPTGWPTLPPNASLAAEVAWVHANRIRVRQGEGVDLSKAISPAPSYAALSWLETSILYPSKWADVTVKASQDQADAAEDIRRERLALADLQALLAEAVSAIP